MSEIVFILGPGGAGTSAIAGLLTLCGCSPPHSLMASDASHPKGYWEPREALRLNDEFLRRIGSSYFDPTMILDGNIEVDSGERQRFSEQIGEFLLSCPRTPLLVIKEPRITPLFEFWSAAARRNGFSERVIIATRHPNEVSLSEARYGIVPELSTAIWLKHSLLAEHHTRNLLRIVVEYANLMRDWRVELSRITRSLSLNLNPSADADEFLSPELYRIKCNEAVNDMFGCRWTSRVYSALLHAANDGELNIHEMDEIYASYQASARAFRISVEEFRSLQKASDGTEEARNSTSRGPENPQITGT